MEDPYRIQAQLPMIQEYKSAHILFIYGEQFNKCPCCNETYALEGYFKVDIKRIYCTPFKRVVLKRYLFYPNLICNIKGAHWHTWCPEKDCQTHWITMIKKDLDIREI
jgi:hypothetical protein